MATPPEPFSPIDFPTPVNDRGRTKETLKSRLILPQDLAQHAQHVKPCHDPGLTALVQLGALKLNVSRCMVSLFDRQHQHVIAEATQASTLDPDGYVESEKTRLWLCGTALPRSQVYPSEHIISSTPLPATTPVLVVPDLLKDDRWSSRFCLDEWPYTRFYAGVPICSKKGMRIGTFDVYDSTPRAGLGEDGLQFLRDISKAVMSYLESRAAIESIHRGERMVRGLGSFVEGMATLMSTTSKFENSAGQEEGLLNDKQQDKQRELDKIGKGRRKVNSQEPVPSLHGRTPLLKPQTISLGTNSGPHPTRISSGPIPANSLFSAKSTGVTTPNPHILELRAAFSRASNVLRESVEVEGALFLDASISASGGLLEDHRQNKTKDISNTSQSRRPLRDSIQYCDVLGFSTSASSSVDGMISPEQLLVPESLLRSLLAKYPAGRIFNFDSEGGYLSGDSELDDTGFSLDARPEPSLETSEKRKRRASGRFNSLESQSKAIIDIFPGARSVAIVPLWDSIKERWYASAILWTHSRNRIFTVEGELSFLRAFGTTIMAEVQRLNAMMAEKAKNDFLGSLSHELRSPLHGVLGAVELLNDTAIDAFQGDAIHTIETSGRTLLDTMDHLLDYCKVNTYFTSSKLARRGSQPLGSLDSQRQEDNSEESLVTDTSIDLIVEEVAESMFAGYNFQRKSIAQLKSKRQGQHADQQANSQLDSAAAVEAFGHTADASGNPHHNHDGVQVFLDIDPTATWDFCTQPGAIRRVVMNIFGNSLKFTQKGFIWISLRQSGIPDQNSSSRMRNVVITIADSGNGIREDFLMNRLFSPFAQESNLTPGLGLGLSVVRQVSHALGGSVKVTSQSGQGTTVQVTIPLSRSDNTVARDNELLGHLDEIRDLRICLRGFDQCFEPVLEEASGLPSQLSEAAVMEMLCRDWLGMQIIPISAAEEERPDLFVMSQSNFLDVGELGKVATLEAPTVVVCQDALTAHVFAKSPVKRVTGFISQPVGYKRLARSLALCLSRWKQESTSSIRSESRASTPKQDSVVASINRHKRNAVGEHVPQCSKRANENNTGHCCSPPASLVSEAATGMRSSPTLDKLPGTPPSPIHLGDKKSALERSQAKYLLVDDNDINLRILASFMRKLGHSYDTASNGLQALEKYSANPSLYQVILMDLSMPVMDGLEATERIREYEKFNNVNPTTVIALTGLASASVQREAMAKGMDVFLTKPVNLAGLKGILSSHEKSRF